MRNISTLTTMVMVISTELFLILPPLPNTPLTSVDLAEYGVTQLWLNIRCLRHDNIQHVFVL